MKRGCPANVGSPVFFPAGTRPATPDRHPAPGERDHGVVDSRAAGEGEDREHDLVRSHLGALQHLLHELELGRVVGRGDLHRHAREAIRLRHLDVSLAAEASPAELVELHLVLATDEGVAEDEEVVEVDVRVRPGEIGRAGQKRRVTGLRGLAVEVVAEDDFWWKISGLKSPRVWTSERRSAQARRNQAPNPARESG